jgi:hypothetical protein
MASRTFEEALVEAVCREQRLLAERAVTLRAWFDPPAPMPGEREFIQRLRAEHAAFMAGFSHLTLDRYCRRLLAAEDEFAAAIEPVARRQRRCRPTPPDDDDTIYAPGPGVVEYYRRLLEARARRPRT